MSEFERILDQALKEHPIYTLEGIAERLFILNFRGFVYNQIWEDPKVDLEALQLNSHSRIVTISSAGCNVLNYLVQSPSWITAVDLNPNHLSLTRLKLACLRYLPSYEDFWNFFGVGKGCRNIEMYKRHVRDHLDETTRRFWEGGAVRRLTRNSRIHYFRKGFYRYALLGRLIQTLNRVARFTVGSTEDLKYASSIEDQEKFWEEKVAPFFDKKLVRFIANTPMWTIGMGIPPQQKRIIEDEIGGSVTNLFLERSKRLVAGFPLDENYFVWQALLGGYDTENRKAVPEYLKPENHAVLRDNADRVDTHQITLIEHFKNQPDNTYNRFVLLDSMDWMKPHQIAAQWKEIARVGEDGSRIIFRTGASRSPIEDALPEELSEYFVYEKDLSEALHRQDRAAVYGGFHCYILDKKAKRSFAVPFNEASRVTT